MKRQFVPILDEFEPPTPEEQEAINKELEEAKGIKPSALKEGDKASAVTPYSDVEEVEKEEPLITPESIKAFALSSAQGGLMGFGEELLGGLEAAKETAFGDKELKDLYKTFQEAKKKNEEAYEELRRRNPGAVLAGEIAGGFAVPMGTGLAGALAKVSGLKKGLGALGVNKLIAEHIATGATGAGLSGLGASKGTIAGSLGLTEEEGVGGDVLTSSALGAGLGLTTGVVSKLGKEAMDWLGSSPTGRRFLAARQLEAGSREGYDGPINMREAPAIEPFAKKSGGQKITEKVEDIAKEIRDDAASARQFVKDKLQEDLKNANDTSVNVPGGREAAFNKMRQQLFDKIRFSRKMTADELNDFLYSDPSRMAKFNKRVEEEFFQTFKKKYNDTDFEELRKLFAQFKVAHPRVSKLLREVDYTITNKILSNKDPITVPELFTFRRQLVKKANEFADAFNLSTQDRDMLYGKPGTPFEGKGVFDQVDNILAKYVSDIKDTRAAVGIKSAPIETLLNKSDDISLHKIKAFDLSDESVQQRVQNEVKKLIQLSGGRSQQADDAAKRLQEYFQQVISTNLDLLKRGVITEQQFATSSKKLDELVKKAKSAGIDFSTLVAIKGIETFADKSPAQVINEFKSMGGQTFTGLGARLGATQRLMREQGASLPGFIRKPISVPTKGYIDFRKASTDELKQMAELLAQSKNPFYQNLGRGAAESLATNQMGKAVLLNTALQNPDIRKELGFSLTDKGKVELKEEEEEE
jgi:hypothetical protein